MKLTIKSTARRHRFLHLTQLRNRVIILTDNNFEIILTHSPGCTVRMGYRPTLGRGCHLLSNCIKLDDGTSVKMLLMCGLKYNLFVSLPVVRAMEAPELTLLRLFHDEKLPILQAIESANEIAATLSGLSPALLVRVDRSLKVILSGCNRVLGTINSVSDSAAGALGGRLMQYRRVDLVQHVRAICVRTTPLALEGGINLRYHSDASRVDAMVDPEFVTRIVENLLSNAIRHTPVGGTVWVRVDLSGDEWLRLSVVDDGEGVPEEIKDRLFGCFVTGCGNSRAGAGLGLYNVRMFAEKMGGKVRCVSTPGHGARFEVDLPVVVGAERPDSADAPPCCSEARAL